MLVHRTLKLFDTRSDSLDHLHEALLLLHRLPCPLQTHTLQLFFVSVSKVWVSDFRTFSVG